MSDWLTSVDQGKPAKRLLSGHFSFASFRVFDRPIAPSRAMDARWNEQPAELCLDRLGTQPRALHRLMAGVGLPGPIARGTSAKLFACDDELDERAPSPPGEASSHGTTVVRTARS